MRRPNLKSLINAYLKDKHNKPRNSKNFSLSPSILGDDCLRKIYYSYYRIEQAPKTIDNILMLEGGNSLHDHIQKILKDVGLAVDYHDPKTGVVDVEFPISFPEWKVGKGYIDRVLIDGKKIYLVEIKSAGDAKYKYHIKEPQNDHKVQGTTYIFAFEKNLYEGKYDHIKELSKDMLVEGIYFLYVNRDNYQMKEYFVKRDEEHFLEIDQKVNKLLKYIEKKELPPLKNGKLCKWCPYPDWCKNNKNVK